MSPEILERILSTLVPIGIFSGLLWFLLMLKGPVRSLGRLGNSIAWAALGMLFILSQLCSLILRNIDGPWQDLRLTVPVMLGFAFFFLIAGYFYFSQRWKS